MFFQDGQRGNQTQDLSSQTIFNPLLQNTDQIETMKKRKYLQCVRMFSPMFHASPELF